mmetsp:Transcript_47513/g.124531  ORF Transcript_47513/g.124531 Transcript_47513/m.124531 type:complete len:446 (+) Transcript_47513:471-1808(+)
MRAHTNTTAERPASLAPPMHANAASSATATAASAASTAAVLIVVAGRTVGGLHPLCNRLLVVALIVQLPLEVVREYLQRLSQQLEVRLRLEPRLLRRGVLVGVPLERALLVRGLDLQGRRDGRHLQQHVVIRPLLLAHLERRPLQSVAHLRVILERLRESAHVLQRLGVPAERVQGLGLCEPCGLAIVHRIDRHRAIFERLIVRLQAQLRRGALRVERGFQRGVRRRADEREGLSVFLRSALKLPAGRRLLGGVKVALKLPHLLHCLRALAVVGVEAERLPQMLLRLVERRALVEICREEQRMRTQHVRFRHVRMRLDHLQCRTQSAVAQAETELRAHEQELRRGGVRLREHVGEEGARQAVVLVRQRHQSLLVPCEHLRDRRELWLQARLLRTAHTLREGAARLGVLALLAVGLGESLVRLARRRVQPERRLAVEHRVRIVGCR